MRSFKKQISKIFSYIPSPSVTYNHKFRWYSISCFSIPSLQRGTIPSSNDAFVLSNVPDSAVVARPLVLSPRRIPFPRTFLIQQVVQLTSMQALKMMKKIITPNNTDTRERTFQSTPFNVFFQPQDSDFS